MARNNRLFISFAVPEDTWARDFLVGQARGAHSPFHFVDMSVKTPWDSQWKTNCRTKIRGCDGLIVMVSKNTERSSGALWEVRCALEERIPVIGVWAYSDDSSVPFELLGIRIIPWNWQGIANFITRL
ncbi:TIR domain-containing protein [Corallococcus macrosporus]|uniref:TIR domain-containing protein n=1 Tax=Corallococcus macrosporus TaxID=35 RepID=UPI000BB370CB